MSFPALYASEESGRTPWFLVSEAADAIQQLDDVFSSLSRHLKQIFLLDEDNCLITIGNPRLVKDIRLLFPKTAALNLFTF